MQNPLTRLFGSKLRAKVIGWFFNHADEKFFVRQLAALLKEDSTNLSRELSKLERMGILISTRQGNLKIFEADRTCPFFDELKGLAMKTVGSAGSIRAGLESVPNVDLAFIYGSFAKGTENSGSDIDLMLIGDVDLDLIDPLIDKLESDLGRTINYVAYDKREFAQKKHKRDGFITDVLKSKKIMLKGSMDDLARA